MLSPVGCSVGTNPLAFAFSDRIELNVVANSSTSTSSFKYVAIFSSIPFPLRVFCNSKNCFCALTSACDFSKSASLRSISSSASVLVGLSSSILALSSLISFEYRDLNLSSALWIFLETSSSVYVTGSLLSSAPSTLVSVSSVFTSVSVTVSFVASSATAMFSFILIKPFPVSESCPIKNVSCSRSIKNLFLYKTNNRLYSILRNG